MSLYKISDEDIDAVVRYMSIFHPEKAYREYVRAMLAAFKDGVKQIALKNTDDLEKLFEDYEKKLVEDSER